MTAGLQHLDRSLRDDVRSFSPKQGSYTDFDLLTKVGYKSVKIGKVTPRSGPGCGVKAAAAGPLFSLIQSHLRFLTPTKFLSLSR